MWIRNLDTGKWFLQTDELPKDYYDGLKQDIKAVQLYSRCLSGSVYIRIDDLDNIYDTLGIDDIGYYINDFLASSDSPPTGPLKSIDSSKYEFFYNKYLKENAFTVKNLFTPNKLINTENNNLISVDVSTTDMILNISDSNRYQIIDGLKLVDGHRVLLKDQITKVTLLSSVDPEDYFTNTVLVSKYYILETIGNSITYYYYNQDNGIYTYTNNQLIKSDHLSNYDKSYKFKVFVKYGNTNHDKEFHLDRLRNNYFPIDGENISFSEGTSWILRHRLDYNNVLDLNYYDLLKSEGTSVYSKVENFTYSIPPRLIAIGEFGAIINSQEDVSNQTYTSNIMKTDYKVNYRSITETNDYYWICGDEGILLKVYKPDFSIKRIDLGIFSRLNCITFFDELCGFVVGDFNRIFYTDDGGAKWNSLNFSEYDSYSFYKVLFKGINDVYISGTNGLFLELTRNNNTWSSYKRFIYKKTNNDRYDLTEDIYDLLLTKWNYIKPFSYVNNSNSLDFSDNIVFTVSNSDVNSNEIKISISHKYFDNKNYPSSSFFIFLSLSGPTGTIYSDDLNDPPMDWSIYQFTNRKNKFEKVIEVPIDPTTGNIHSGDYVLDVYIEYDYDAENDEILGSDLSNQFSINFGSTDTDILLLSSDNKVIVYDLNRKIFDSKNDFIYVEFDKTTDGIRTMTRPVLDGRVFIGANNSYSFDLACLTNAKDDFNFVTTALKNGPEKYLNKIISSDKFYYVGNESLFEYIEFADFENSTTTPVDSTFGSKYKPRLLFMDYDIASKLNFFTDMGQYRLPSSIEIPFDNVEPSSSFPNPYLELKSLDNQKSWIDYYKDVDKTFEYYTAINDSYKIEFSTKFTYTDNPKDWTITKNQITTDVSDILKFAPSLKSKELSEYYEGVDEILMSTQNLSSQPSTLSNYDVLIYKNIIIFKRNITDRAEVGDILRLESDVIDCNLIVNKITYYYKKSGSYFEKVDTIPTNIGGSDVLEKYIYCFNTFNKNIVNNLKKYNGNINIINLNKYETIDELTERLQKHTISIGYDFSEVYFNRFIIKPRLNNKTAYYSLAIQAETPQNTYLSDYNESFLAFGYSPIYNILDVLQRIDSSIFTDDKKFFILPEYYGLDATDNDTFAVDNVKVYKDFFSNKLVFGTDLKFYWESFLLWTFVDVEINGTTPTTQLLIISKYYDESAGGYVLEFHKKLGFPKSSISSINILSRNTLKKISEDLQTLNNIHRPSTTKPFNGIDDLTNLESEVRFKFPTDSYFKALVSDYEIQEKVTGIVYTDYDYQLVMNIINVSKDLEFSFGSITDDIGKVAYTINGDFGDRIKVGDLVYIHLQGDEDSSRGLNPQYEGYQTIINISGKVVTTSMDYGVPANSSDFGVLKFVKKDYFLNYQPIDLFNISSDKRPKKSIEILPEMVKLSESTFSLQNVNINKFKLQFVDGLFLQDIEEKYSWFLQAETSNAVIGKNENGLVWYSGIWRCGRWFGGTWISGEWLGGDWYEGDWYSSKVNIDKFTVKISSVNSNPRQSKWQGGRWFGGSWYGGSWFNGRRYGGDWYDGIWYNGIWNDGNWSGGAFQGGIWVYGKWMGGKFNCDTRPSFWLDGVFESGDFENGIWYNGQFGNEQKRLSRFGTRSINTRITTWHGGKWLNGEFHSYLNQDSITNEPLVSDVHYLTVWRTGIWLGGDFYGGIAYNIDFRAGTWHGGILEEIQIVGVDPIYPTATSSNSIYLNGIFKFNPGDTIYILDDYSNSDFSALGSNDKVGIYRVNKIEENFDTTKVFLNYNLGLLNPPIDQSVGIQSWFNVDTQLRCVSHFVESNWKSGLWTNGYFESGKFESGIWYNGVFEGIWGS